MFQLHSISVWVVEDAGLVVWVLLFVLISVVLGLSFGCTRLAHPRPRDAMLTVAAREPSAHELSPRSLGTVRKHDTKLSRSNVATSCA